MDYSSQSCFSFSFRLSRHSSHALTQLFIKENRKEEYLEAFIFVYYDKI